MQEIIIPIVAFLASLLTFFSGFGLGTLLMPVFAIFYPVEIAVALTGVVHLLNNIFKISLVFKHIDVSVVLRFGVPAIFMAILGAMVLTGSVGEQPYHSYVWLDQTLEMTTTKTIIGSLMLLFAVLEVTPSFKTWQFGKKHLIAGGALSGFFGGLSGHQGALRSMFLLKAGLTKEQFIATGIAIACAVDIGRLSVYWKSMVETGWMDRWKLLTVTVLSAFIGAYFGKKLLKKVTISFLQIIVSLLISIMGIALILGLV